MTVDLQNPIFHDETAAREALEAVRWPDGPVCPHCGNVDADTMPLVEGKKRTHRPGLRYCNACKGQFTVTVGTVFERSKIPLAKWWLAMHLMGSSKKGMSAHQLWRMLGLGSYRTAWFMAHRIREAMADINTGPIGGEGEVVEADETYFGQRENPKPSPQRKGRPYIKKGKAAQKRPVVALVERGGQVRMFHVQDANAANVRDILVRNVDRKSDLHTDDTVEKLFLIAGSSADSVSQVIWETVGDDGTEEGSAGGVVLRVLARGPCPGRSPVALD